jgi:hypothetical protein
VPLNPSAMSTNNIYNSDLCFFITDTFLICHLEHYFSCKHIPFANLNSDHRSLKKIGAGISSVSIVLVPPPEFSSLK